jgi:hypothetical protein
MTQSSCETEVAGRQAEVPFDRTANPTGATLLPATEAILSPAKTVVPFVCTEAARHETDAPFRQTELQILRTATARCQTARQFLPAISQIPLFFENFLNFTVGRRCSAAQSRQRGSTALPFNNFSAPTFLRMEKSNRKEVNYHGKRSNTHH